MGRGWLQGPTHWNLFPEVTRDLVLGTTEGKLAFAGHWWGHSAWELMKYS